MHNINLINSSGFKAEDLMYVYQEGSVACQNGQFEQDQTNYLTS